MVPANYSDTDSDLERTEDYVFLQVSAIWVLNSQLSLFRSQLLQLCRQAWALGGFLKSGKMLFNSTPFYHRYHKNCDFITGTTRIRRSILFNHGTFCSVKTVLSIQIFLLPGYFWLGPHGESALLPVSRPGRGGNSTCRGLDKTLTHFSWNWTHFWHFLL